MLVLLAFSSPATAATTFTVDDGGDGHDRSTADGVCDAAPDGQPAFCTLRAAIEQANALAGEDIVDVEVFDVSLTLADGGAIEIDSDLVVKGLSADSTTVSQEVNRGFGDRVFDIAAGTKVTLDALTIRDGEANAANNHFGGNIRSSGALTIQNSTITGGVGNSAGGVANVGGSLRIERSTLTGNSAPADAGAGGDAGAILNFGTATPATLTIESSTISGNDARLGGGIFSWNNAENSITIANSTIAFNDSGDRGGGGGLAVNDGTATVRNTILANNTSPSEGQNCSTAGDATISSDGYNLESGSDCDFALGTDQQDADPLLDPLGFNDGTTQTHALGPGSPAIDTGDPECPSEDQRTLPRPQRAGCDIGAFELEGPTFQDIFSAGPVDHIYLGNDLRCQAHYVGDEADSFFGGVPGSCGTRLRVGDVNASLIPIEQTGVKGTGSESDPFQVVTRVEAADTSLEITRTDTYVLGDDFYRSDVRVSSSAATEQPALLWHWADCFLQDSDIGYGTFDQATGGVYCSANANNSPPARIEGFVPLSAGAQWFEGAYSDASNPPVGGFPNTCRCGEQIDNGMGLSWNIVVPPEGSTTRSFLSAFSPRGTVFDNVPPQTEITDGPSGATGDSTPTFSFSASEPATFECSVDGGQFASCSSPHTTTALGDGPHVFSVRATDLAGNVDQSPAERQITVETPDQTPPETTIDAGPTGPTDDHSPTFVFSAAEPGSRFECSVDDGPFEPCASPFTTAPLPPGRHTLAVRAIDSAGNVDATPSVVEFVIEALTVADLPDPAQGETLNVEEVAGIVLIGIPNAAARSSGGCAGEPEGRDVRAVVGGASGAGRLVPRHAQGHGPAPERARPRSAPARPAPSSTRSSRCASRASAALKGRTDLILKGGSFSRCRSVGKRQAPAPPASAAARSGACAPTPAGASAPAAATARPPCAARSGTPPTAATARSPRSGAAASPCATSAANATSS